MNHRRLAPCRSQSLFEKKRIVSKVTELLSLCDALEGKLTQSESASNQLILAGTEPQVNLMERILGERPIGQTARPGGLRHGVLAGRGRRRADASHERSAGVCG